MAPPAAQIKAPLDDDAPSLANASASDTTDDAATNAAPEAEGADSASGANESEPATNATIDEAEGADACEPPEREDIVALESWCHAPLGTGCMRCAAACPTGAIEVTEEGPRIDEESCTRCGLCLGVCDAFGWSRITLEDLYERAAREAKEEGMVCFTCNDHVFPGLALRSNVIVLPCLAAVPPEFWSALLATDIPVGVYRDPSYCATCTAAGLRGTLLFDHARTTAEGWTRRTIREIDELPERETFLAALSHFDEGDRRALLSKFANESADVALGKHRKRNAGTVDAFHERQERLRARGRIAGATRPAALGPEKRPWPRQELMVKAARALSERAALLERYCATTNADACTRSGACVAACPTGARALSSDGQAPSCNPALCIACGACVAACAAGACDFTAITAADYFA